MEWLALLSQHREKVARQMAEMAAARLGPSFDFAQDEHIFCCEAYWVPVFACGETGMTTGRGDAWAAVSALGLRRLIKQLDQPSRPY